MLLLLMLTSKGMAGVPRASLVVIAATLASFNLPEAGLLLIIGIDQFLDMGRSATNVIGNSLATAVVAKWEGEKLHQPGRAGADPTSGVSRVMRARLASSRPCFRGGGHPARRGAGHVPGQVSARCPER